MCPIWPLHLVVLYLLALLPLWLVVANASSWNLKFRPSTLFKVVEGETKRVLISSARADVLGAGPDGSVELCSANPKIAYLDSPAVIFLNSTPFQDDRWEAGFNITGSFLGKTTVKARLKNGQGTILKETVNSTLPVTVVRPVRLIDEMFTYSVVILVSIIFINMGCALDWEVIKKVFKRPIGPVVAFISQFLFMPLISFGLAKLLFPLQASIQLGMFVTGCSPGGGASNIWALTLGASLNLSIAMTAISTVSAFFMIPFWVFTLGQIIFRDGNIVVPYSKIGTFVVGLIIPLVLGLLIQRFLPRVSKFLVRILKPFAALLIIFIIIFAIYTNLYLFSLFSWQIVVAGLGLPWLGYCFGALFAKICRLPWEDYLAVGIETGVQNTGLAIFMLRFTLGQPDADLATVVPVSVAIMTPIPLILLYLAQRVYYWQKKTKEEDLGYTLTYDGATPITYVQ